MKIRAKIFLFIFITSFLVFAIVITYIAYNYRNYSIEQANRLVNIYVLNAANSVKSTLDKDLMVCETVAQSFKDYAKIPANWREPIYNDILKNVLAAHPEYLSIWMSWELRFIQSGYTEKYGRKRTVAIRESGVNHFVIDTVEIDGDNIGSPYYQSKITKNDVLLDPYYYIYSPQDGGDSILETSIAKPLIINGEFAGVIGIDITLDRFQQIIDEIRPFEKAYALLLSNNGTIISSPNKAYHGDSLYSKFPAFVKNDVLVKIKAGENFSFIYSDSLGLSNYVSIAPIKVGKTESPWSICLVVPSKTIEKESIRYFYYSLLIGSIGILIFSFITLAIARRITLPLMQTTSILKDLDKGVIDPSKKLKVHSKDELAEMGKSLNNLLDTLSKTVEFAKKIGKGDFNVQYTALSKYDVLGNTLIEMQKNLRIGQEQEELRQLDRAKQNWAQDGLSQLGEVLRTSTDNFEDYLYVILGQIVTYVKADQGGIFILNAGDSKNPYLELLAAYAYNKKKSLQAKIEIGESLVGRCFQEKEVIFITNLPEGYTFVSSGLGGHEPHCLFLMPLLFEDEPFGVIELASFREFTDFEIEFLKSIGERVASSISIMQKNVHTKQLLDQYQVRSEELSRREQMLQETLQDVRKNQEDDSIKEKENEGIIESINKIASIIWYNLGGTITNFKDPNLNYFGISEKDAIGKKHSEFDIQAKEDVDDYKRFWNDLKAGHSRQRTIKRKTLQGEIWLLETYTPINDKSGKPYKIISIAVNVTEQMKLQEEIEKSQQEISNLKKQINDILH